MSSSQPSESGSVSLIDQDSLDRIEKANRVKAAKELLALKEFNNWNDKTTLVEMIKTTVRFDGKLNLVFFGKDGEIGGTIFTAVKALGGADELSRDYVFTHGSDDGHDRWGDF